jgi:Flp pilus assembly protein TadG
MQVSRQISDVGRWAMMTNRIIAKLRNTWCQFRRATNGSTAVTFAVSFIPIVGLVGMAIDYSRASAVRSTMQAAADATALMIAQNAASSSTDALNQSANDYFFSIFKRTDAQSPTVTATYDTTNGPTVLITATATYNPVIMNVLHVGPFPLQANSTASWGNTRLRVALVLDNTGSMAQDGKMAALIPATKSLLTQLKAAVSTVGDVYVSIVPFVKDVNVDKANYSASWIYWDDAAHTDNTSWDASNGTCSKSGLNDRNSCLSPGNCSLSGYTTQASCVAATGSCNNTNFNTQSTCVANGYCSDPSRHSQNGCTKNGGTWRTPAIWTPGVGVWTQNYTWTPANHNTWNGCVMDRGDLDQPNVGNYDTNVTAPSSGIPATMLPAEQYSPCPQAAMGLSYNWDAMNTVVGNMTSGGNTNQAIGLQLGWMSLVGGGPFNAVAFDSRYKYTQAIILLTDGLNTQDRWYSDSNMCPKTGGGTEMCIDHREKMTCDNAKTSGIQIYTIQVNTSTTKPDPLSAVLQYCAGITQGVGDPTMYWNLTQANQITATFKQIGTQLSKLHIAK